MFIVARSTGVYYASGDIVKRRLVNKDKVDWRRCRVIATRELGQEENQGTRKRGKKFVYVLFEKKSH